MSLADMWNRALMKRNSPSVEQTPPAELAVPAVKRCKSCDHSAPSEDQYMDVLNEMSDDAVDATLQELLKDDGTSRPTLEAVPTATGMGRVCGPTGVMNCCVAPRKAPTRTAPARPAPIKPRKAHIPSKPVAVSATTAEEDDAMKVDQSPGSVIQKMLYPNLFQQQV